MIGAKPNLGFCLIKFWAATGEMLDTKVDEESKRWASSAIWAACGSGIEPVAVFRLGSGMDPVLSVTPVSMTSGPESASGATGKTIELVVVSSEKPLDVWNI